MRSSSTAFITSCAGIVLVVLVLAGCGSKSQPEAQPTPPPVVQQPAADSSSEQPEPAAETSPTDLPGRLLFVQGGTVWLWQGTTMQPLFGDGAVWQPEWSPDGRQIAYIERGESYSNVMLADSSGSSLVQLTNYGSELPLRSHERIFDTMWAFYPTWSPDGTTIAVASQYGPPVASASGAVEYNMALYAIPADGGSRTLLYSDDMAHCGAMAYTPDETTLIYTRASLDGSGQQLYRLNLATEVSEPFPGAPAYSYEPVLSNDGEWLVFTARDQDGSDIWLLPANPDEERYIAPQRLTTLGQARAPVFSPDDTKIAFLAIPEGGSTFELWLIDLETQGGEVPQVSAPRQVSDSMGIDADSGLSWSK